MRNLLLLTSACLLSACAGLTASSNLPACAAPVDLPDRALSDQDIEILWGRDRVALKNCAAKVEVLSGRAAARDRLHLSH